MSAASEDEKSTKSDNTSSHRTKSSFSNDSSRKRYKSSSDSTTEMYRDPEFSKIFANYIESRDSRDMSMKFSDSHDPDVFPKSLLDGYHR